MIKKIFLLTTFIVFFSSATYAEKIECDLLSPIQKKIYKAYCQSQAKAGDNSANEKMKKPEIGNLLKKFKVNTDSKLFKTGKYAK